MNIDAIDIPSGSLVLPANEALRQANGGQFALMLSLMFEAQQNGQLIPVSQQGSVTTDTPSRLINGALGVALQGNNAAHFNLLNSLYQERYLARSEQLVKERAEPYQPAGAAGFRERRGAAMIDEIEQAKNQGHSLQ